MKTPSILTLVNRALRKLKACPYDGYPATYNYRNPLLSTVVTLLSSIPEDSEVRNSESFKKSVKSLFIEDFSGRSHRGHSEPFMKYLDPDFINEHILQNTTIWPSEKHRWVAEEALFAYYERKSLTDLSFGFRHNKEIIKWFRGLTEEKRTEILTKRLNLAVKDECGRNDEVIFEIMTYSDDDELWKQLAGYVDEYMHWDSIFYSDECFDPESDKGIRIIPIAENLKPELWILQTISSLGNVAEYEIDEKIQKIRQYFGHVNAPQAGVRDLMAKALQENDPKKLKFYSGFIA